MGPSTTPTRTPTPTSSLVLICAETSQRAVKPGGWTSPIRDEHFVGARRTYELELHAEHWHQAVVKSDVCHLDGRTQARQRRIAYECEDAVPEACLVGAQEISGVLGVKLKVRVRVHRTDGYG